MNRGKYSESTVSRIGFLILILLMPAGKSAGFSIEKQDTVKILWIGSSSTYCHDLPSQTAVWLEDFFAPRPVRSYMVGKSGTGFHEYLQPDFEAQYGLKQGQTLLDKIAEEKYDYVVLQMITYFIGAELQEETVESTEILLEAISESGASPVFYEMGWRLGPENEIGRNLIAGLAQKYQVPYFGACSSAWKAVRANRTDLELHNLPDQDHPGTLGTYLNLAGMYIAITGKKPNREITQIEVWPRFGAFDKEEAGKKLAQTTLSPYYLVMPEWMQKISVMRTSVQIDPDIAKFLIDQAYQTWKLKKAEINNLNHHGKS
jgi:hypothetical protein